MMPTTHPIRLAGAAVAALALVAAVPAAAGAAVTAKWTVVPAVPVPAGAANAQLQSVTVSSAKDIWSAGAWWDATLAHPLLVNFDGTAWKTADLPTLPPDTYLSGVDALGATDVWAVGSTVTRAAQTSPSTPSLLHYNGLEWQTVPAPAFAAGSGNDLAALDMRTSADGWAVGETETSTSGDLPLILRWQGGKWSTSAAPKVAAGSGLVAVSARAADDVWAVGTQVVSTGASQALVLHFDGAAWSQVKIPTAAGTALGAVAATGPGDVWVAGKACAVSCAATVWHLSAAGWQSVPTTGGTEVTALVAFSPTNLWTLGYQTLPNVAQADHVEHWDGTKLTAEDTGLPPSVPAVKNQGELGSATPIFAAAGNPATEELWAVGWSEPPTVTPRVIHRG